MIILLSPHITRRIEYVSHIVFKQLLQLPYQIQTLATYLPQEMDYVLSYGVKSMAQSLEIPNSGLLFEKGICEYEINLLEEDLPYLFYQSSKTNQALPFDLFSAVFYLLSEYDKYLFTEVDAHGRYQLNAYISNKLPLDQRPLVHLYVEKLRAAISSRWPEFVFPQSHSYDYEITIDIDHPWKYLHKGAHIFWGGILKDLLGGKWRDCQARLLSLKSGKDPNDTFGMIYELCPAEKTRFFFLLARNSRYDNRFSAGNKYYRALIREIQAKGYTVGIHPSYTSFMDRSRIEYETALLREITGQAVNTSRQHFLKYRLPHSFRYLEEVGIRDEYTLCNFEQGGFPTGMARPYLWYDLEQERISSLRLHPTISMDWSLKQYMGLSPEAAIDRCKHWIESCQAVGGIFTFLIHHDALSEAGEWKGWRSAMLEILKEMRQGN